MISPTAGDDLITRGVLVNTAQLLEGDHKTAREQHLKIHVRPPYVVGKEQAFGLETAAVPREFASLFAVTHKEQVTDLEAQERLSGLAAYFAKTFKDCPIEDRQEASLVDVVDSAMRSMHEATVSCMPSVASMERNFPVTDRGETVLWIFQAFEVMGFSDHALFQTALILDRYYAKNHKSANIAPQSQESQEILIAAVCLALKIGPRPDVAFSLRMIVSHLSRQNMRAEAVMQAELRILRALRFVVGSPTVQDFLEVLSIRLAVFDSRISSLASYLLQLSLADAGLFHRYPPAVLVAAALALSLSTVQAPAEAYAVLKEDFALHFEAGAKEPSMLVPCCSDLHVFWLSSTTWLQSPAWKVAQHLQTKFAKKNYHGVSLLSPPFPTLPAVPFLS